MTGVYTSLRTRDGQLPPTWDAHMRRLRRDADAVGLPRPMDSDHLAALVRDHVARDGHDGVRIEVTGDGMTCAITRQPGRTEPATAITMVGVRPQAQHKTIGDPVVSWARAAAQRAGSSDALLVRGGAVLEADSAAIAVVIGRDLVTPRGPLLPSITMDEVSRHARTIGLAIVRRSLALAELHAADEALLASAVRGIRPLVRVDGQRVGCGRPGPFSTRIAAAWHRDHVTQP